MFLDKSKGKRMITGKPLSQSKYFAVDLPPLPIVLALLTIYLIWGSTYLVITFAIETIPPLLMTGIRFMVAGMGLMAFLRWRGETMPTGKQWRNAFFIGTLMMGAGQGGVAFAEQWVGSGLTALLIAVLPLWAVLFASFVERLPYRLEVAGLFVGLCGVAIMNFGGDMWVEPAGAIVLIVSPMCWSLGSIWSRHADMPKGLMSTAAMLLSAAVVLLLMGILNGEQLTQVPSLTSIAAMLYLAIFGSIIAFGAYVYLLRNATAAIATSYAYVNPIIAVVLGWLFAGEELTPVIAIAAVFILSAVVLINLSSVSKGRGKSKML
jgi:drug/metabolite transporter (DMT)-like permease